MKTNKWVWVGYMFLGIILLVALPFIRIVGADHIFVFFLVQGLGLYMLIVGIALKLRQDILTELRDLLKKDDSNVPPPTDKPSTREE